MHRNGRQTAPESSGVRTSLITLLLALVSLQLVLTGWLLYRDLTRPGNLTGADLPSVSVDLTTNETAAVSQTDENPADAVNHQNAGAEAESEPAAVIDRDDEVLTDQTPAQETVVPVKLPVHVEVLNGTGTSRLALRTGEFLTRDRNMDVRDTRNASRHDYRNTRVICRSGDRRQGVLVAELLNLELDQITMSEDPELVDVDVTLILGEDFHLPGRH